MAEISFGGRGHCLKTVKCRAHKTIRKFFLARGSGALVACAANIRKSGGKNKHVPQALGALFGLAWFSLSLAAERRVSNVRPCQPTHPSHCTSSFSRQSPKTGYTTNQLRIGSVCVSVLVRVCVRVAHARYAEGFQAQDGQVSLNWGKAAATANGPTRPSQEV